jgi:hypothetical protein
MNHLPYFPDAAVIEAMRQQLALIAADIATAEQVQRARHLRVDLAWALRQRDTPEALRLLAQAGELADSPRAQLVAAEAAWLYNRNAEALALCDRARPHSKRGKTQRLWRRASVARDHPLGRWRRQLGRLAAGAGLLPMCRRWGAHPSDRSLDRLPGRDGAARGPARPLADDAGQRARTAGSGR